MKNFFYKVIITFIFVLIFYHITLGSKIRAIESKLENLKSKENLEYVKNKSREEIKVAIKKERYLSEEDAKLINSFLKKIIKELETQ